MEIVTFKCGHPKSAENTGLQTGGKYTYCKTCKRASDKARREANPEAERRRVREAMRKRRGGLKGNRNGKKTHCPQGHPYDEENTYTAPDGARQCKTCRRGRVIADYAKHRETRLEGMRQWRVANIEIHRENARRWLRENRERANLTSRLKKQRRRAAGTLTADEWETVLVAYDRKCLACGTDENITIDHVHPVSKGGSNTIDNVQPLCSPCNTSKGTKTIDYRPDLAAA